MDTRERIIALLGSVDRPGIGNIIRFLEESTFFTVQCFRHHRYDGGLADHSLEVYDSMCRSCSGMPQDSIVVTSLLHDICKARRADCDWIHGHGRRSVRIISDICGMRLTDEEYKAIKLHMHHDAPEIRSSHLGSCLCHSDGQSARHGRKNRTDFK